MPTNRGGTNRPAGQSPAEATIKEAFLHALFVPPLVIAAPAFSQDATSSKDLNTQAYVELLKTSLWPSPSSGFIDCVTCIADLILASLR